MKNFEELIKEYSSEYQIQQDRIKKSNDFFRENYLGNSTYSTFSLPFVPGSIYSFEYKTPSKLSDKRKFINRNPIFLFMNYVKNSEGENILHGIDLLTIPPEIRQIVLSRIWNSFKDLIEKNTNSKFQKSPLPLTPPILDSILNKIQ